MKKVNKSSKVAKKVVVAKPKAPTKSKPKALVSKQNPKVRNTSKMTVANLKKMGRG